MSVSSRIRIATGLFAVIGIAGLGTTACGGDSGTTTATVPTMSITASQKDSAASPRSSATATVGGPRLPAPSSIPQSHRAPEVAGHRCGTANGPEGALDVVIFTGGVPCSTVLAVARAFGPKIALAKPQNINGWECGPSQSAGVLATCTRGNQAFGYVPA